jgi:hypothetical protein
MVRVRTGLALTWLTTAALTAAFPAPTAVATSALQPGAYSVEVSDVSAKVGEHVVMHVTLRLHDGYRVLEAYTNRVSRFSSLDDSVAFDDKTVSGAVQDNTLVFAVGVTPTKLGRHPINGVFRVGYIEDSENMAEVSVPLIANVTGTQ